MGLFGFGRKKKEIQQKQSVHPANRNPSGIVPLKKAEVGLERNIVRLKKEQNVDLSQHRARVFVVLDYSGSMYYLYHNGAVQNTLTRLLPLAMRFDDNGELEVYLFSDHHYQMPAMTLSNYENYVENVILHNGYEPAGGTYYAPIIEQTIHNYDDGSPYPAFGIFITDGDNFDKRETDAAIRQSAEYREFIQFVGIGDNTFSYLQKLDNLSGRKVDNTAFIRVSSFDALNDDQLYALLLKQYPQWLKRMNIQ